MIKDKITPYLKNRFLEEINKSGEIRKERGFLLCLDKKGDIYPTETCEGDECGIHLYSTMEGKCTDKIQGEFHTHPVTNMLREKSKEILGHTPSDDLLKTVLREILKNREKEEGIDITFQMPRIQMSQLRYQVSVQIPQMAQLVLEQIQKTTKQNVGQ